MLHWYPVGLSPDITGSHYWLILEKAAGLGPMVKGYLGQKARGGESSHQRHLPSLRFFHFL